MQNYLDPEPLMTAAGVRGKAGLAEEPPRAVKGLQASSSMYLLDWCWLTP